jgi:hypothetical protein
LSVTKRIIPESFVQGWPLGRHVEHDDLSRNFPAQLAPEVVDVNHSSWGLPLNQLETGKCTAEAFCGARNTRPDRWLRRGPFTDADSTRLYIQETTDEGEPYPQFDPGGSGLAVCKAARELGWCSSYTHTFSFNDALLALVVRPVMTGINWYDSFDKPDSTGLVTISPDAQVRGGHEVFAHQIITAESLVIFWNSWGTDYGVGGQFCMQYATWDRLLSEQGDVTVPVP